MHPFQTFRKLKWGYFKLSLESTLKHNLVFLSYHHDTCVYVCIYLIVYQLKRAKIIQKLIHNAILWLIGKSFCSLWISFDLWDGGSEWKSFRIRPLKYGSLYQYLISINFPTPSIKIVITMEILPCF